MKKIKLNDSGLFAGGIKLSKCDRAVLSGFLSGALAGAGVLSFAGPVGIALGATYGSISGALYGVASSC